MVILHFFIFIEDFQVLYICYSCVPLYFLMVNLWYIITKDCIIFFFFKDFPDYQSLSRSKDTKPPTSILLSPADQYLNVKADHGHCAVFWGIIQLTEMIVLCPTKASILCERLGCLWASALRRCFLHITIISLFASSQISVSLIIQPPAV